MTFYTHSFPRARKPHTCSLCARTIDPGETYTRGFGADGGGAWTWKNCTHCEAFLTRAEVACDVEYGVGDFECFEPSTVTEARWLVQWRRGWRRRDGALYPVPGVAA